MANANPGARPGGSRNGTGMVPIDTRMPPAYRNGSRMTAWRGPRLVAKRHVAGIHPLAARHERRVLRVRCLVDHPIFLATGDGGVI